METDFEVVSGSIIFNSFTDNVKDRPYINWRLQYWDELNGNVTFTENMPSNVPDLVVFFPTLVRVNEASTSTLKKSFHRTSPIFRWRHYIDDSLETIQGLANFDF